MDTQLTDRLQTSFSGEHKSYLAENYPAAYATMQKKGELAPYLQEIGKQAAEMYLRLKGEMRVKAEEIANPAEKMNYINHIPLVVDEIVRSEIIYAKL